MSEKPEALRLADECDWSAKFKAAKELRRLHAENEVLTAKIKAREDEILTHSEAVYEATKLLSEEREKNERLGELLLDIRKDAATSHWHRDIDAALRREPGDG